MMCDGPLPPGFGPATYVRERTDRMGDQLDVPLEDSELLEEVEMVSTLILAASENDERLGQDEIDRILGVHLQEDD
jgi:hypothetical protein